MKGIYWAALLLLLAATVFYLFRFTRLFKTPGLPAHVHHDAFSERLAGVFHRADTSRLIPPRIQHISIQIHAHTSDEELAEAFRTADAGQELLVTVVAGQESALALVSDGDFDDVLGRLCRLLPAAKRVYLRWDPDMEVPVKQFSWQYQAPADYIRAFRHVAEVCRKALPSVQMMWSPAGYPGTEEYWPGSDVVDIMAVSLNGRSEREATAYPPDADMRTALRRKLLRTRFMDKPVFVLATGTDSLVQVLQNDLKAVSTALQQDSALIFQPAVLREPAPRSASTIPLVGVYDPNLALAHAPATRVEHLFVDLEAVQTGKFDKEFRAVVGRGHAVIVSMEPWRDRKVRKDSSVLRNTLAGVYDEEFRSLLSTIAATQKTVYLRFAHEMEIPIHRYAWQSQDPVLYINAFRHFMQLAAGIPNVKKVWGPAGDRGSMEWYPGSDVVDFISIAIYGLPDKNITDPKRQESFETIFHRKAWRMRLASKPLFITEFGVKGPEDFQSGWMEGAARVLREHREVWGICYFNLADNPEVWGDIPAPDWGISRKTYDHFVNVLEKGR